MAKIDTSSETWRAVCAWAEPRLARYRAQNEVSHPIEYTERLRGSIAELKALLELPDEDK